MSIQVDWQELLELLPHRYPFILVDRVIELNPEAKTAVGIKNVTFNEPFFQGHFPGQPIMPGVLILEAMAQTAGVMASKSIPGYKKGDMVYFLGIDKARFRRPVRPGDVLRMEVSTLRSGSKIWKIAAKAFVDDELAAQAELMVQV